MNKTIGLTVVVLTLMLIPVALSAQGGVGIGVILGSPTGLTAKFNLARQSAISVHAGWSLAENTKFHITADHQFLFPGVIHDENGRAIRELSPYLGIGGRVLVHENEPENETEFWMGMRIGGGIEYQISQFGLFIELYPVVNLLPETDFDFEGGLGVIFYF